VELDPRLLLSADEENLCVSDGIINRNKLFGSFPSIAPMNNEDREMLVKTLNSLELIIIDLWDPSSENDKINFIKICNKCFDIMCTLPIPSNSDDKIKYALRLIAYGYLSERWEAARRFLIENEAELILISERNRWNDRIFRIIYLSVFYLVRKRSWDDLTKAVGLIDLLRGEQNEYEKEYLDKINDNYKQSAAIELVSLYHLAKSVELIGTFQSRGEPNDVLDQLGFHFDYAIKYAEISRNIELNLILRILFPTFKQMILNSIWMVAKKVNSRVTKFVEIITRSNKPIIELLYPQRNAILEKELLNPAHKAIVVNLPTSSGKTFIAEFRILQALNQYADRKGWVAYVVPTRALVNQISLRLRLDLSPHPLNIKIEKMCGALELDAYEEQIITKSSDFDILVVTPEKLSLLIRQGIENKLNRPLSLVVVDEAHNLGSKERGIKLEILLSIIKRDCAEANFLLLTPFIPNSDEIAKWLDPQSPKSIGIELNWQPNDKVIGMFYPKGKRHNISTHYKTLLTSNDTINIDPEILIAEKEYVDITVSKLKNKYLLTSLVASEFMNQNGILVIARTIRDVYKMAEIIFNNLPILPQESDEDISLIKKYISSEMGDKFPLIKYLDRGIGIHHSGLPDEIKYLMEFLMEKGTLKYLIATSTIAQGMNFPVSTILMASYSYPYTDAMPAMDFWNLIGRAGRIYQNSIGVIGIATNGGIDSKDAIKLSKYLLGATNKLISVLVTMVDETLESGIDLDLEALYYDSEWSTFSQYISHMYTQSKNLKDFMAELELTMRRTYGYNQLTSNKKQLLLKGVENYAQKLDKKKHLATISDQTGFSPETIQKNISRISLLGIKSDDWNEHVLFSSDSKTLQKLVGIMLKTPEIKKNLSEIKIRGDQITNTSLAELIADWVEGREISEIAKKYFGGDNHTAMSDCVNSIYSKLTYSATWGLAALQHTPGNGLDFETLDDMEKRKLSNLPAMIYYGVHTEEAVLLRKTSVPRMIAHPLGEKLRHDFGDECLKQSTSDLLNWLNNLNVLEWKKAIPINKKISGTEYKAIWKILSGVE
jgi:replicative superfamily II helicase